ncbi:single-stranded DNA-binding protein [Bacillus salacetis]|uniref:Single-stranded DNA-binding protein n=1 Tax=Bacillus salacetis TaxID=2315464 RepID=A0A3A1R2F6_9BACI|nr:single-stranded DNA-binding protein [Bacillus salacetis]RIW36093.1 single-stranded DNA-binding protein [Bacillus salacetis]
MINQVTLVGRLTKDPQMRYTADGKAVLNVTLAVNRQFKNQGGDYEADFVLCTMWKRAAENTAKYCNKGSVLGVVGRIQTRNYDNETGKKVYVTEVVAEQVKFLDGRPVQQQPFPAKPQTQTVPQEQRPAQQPQQRSSEVDQTLPVF